MNVKISCKRMDIAFLTVLVIFLIIPESGLSENGNLDRNGPDKIDAVNSEWEELLKRKPYPHLIPLLSKRTILDGTYVKKAKREGEIIPCRRCPDWLSNPGIWKLNLSRGTYRIYHVDTGWKSIGTYVLAENRILFANDPCCITHIGVYSWQFEDDKLIFKAIDDACAIMLRALNLTEVPWNSCQPPNAEAAISGHWPKPNGCE